MTRSSFVRTIWWGTIIILMTVGVWAFVSPRGFYDSFATYPPFNRHLLRDVGAFNFGLGITLLAAARIRDGLTVALAGAAAAGVAHGLSHIIDAGDGGRSYDPILFSVIGLLLVGAAVARAREVRARHWMRGSGLGQL